MRTTFVLVLLGLCAASAAAQTPPPTAPRLQNPSITLTEAVQATVDNNATLAIETATVQALTGQQQSTSGTFDTLFRVGPSANFTMAAAAPGLINQLKTTRGSIAAIANQYTQLTGALQAVIRTSSISEPRCPANLVSTFGGFSFTNAFLQQPINVDRVDPAELTALGTKTFLSGTSLGDILGSISLSNICTNPAVIGLSPSNFFEAIRAIANTHAIDQSGGQGLIGFLTSVGQIEPEKRLLQLQIADAVAARARLALMRLGPIPIDDVTRTTSLTVGMFKPFRNGVTLSGDLQVQSQDHKFRDRSYDPAFGGLGQPPNFATSLSATLNVPLGQGFGYTAVGAAERSANFLVAAQQANLRHRATEQSLRTALAYLEVIGAREKLAAMEASRTRQLRIVQLTEQAVEGGELPRVEIARARSRATRIESAVSSARATLVGARVSLAEVMGIDADRIEATPMPTETFAKTIVTLPAIDDMITRALSLRRDMRVRQQQEASAATLAAGARSNLKRRFDFSLNAGLMNIYDSPVFRYLPEEQGTILPLSDPIERAVHYYSPRGYYHALIGRYEPFAAANLSIQLPFGNVAARGALKQAESSLATSRIERNDLTRTIRDNVVDVTGQLQKSAAAIANLETAVRADEETLQSVMQRFEIREITLIDTLLTEEAATRDILQLINQRQTYLSALARLKFETGELLTFESEGPSIRVFKFDPSILVAR